MYEATSQRINEPTNQRANESTSQRINEATKQRANESTNEAMRSERVDDKDLSLRESVSQRTLAPQVVVRGSKPTKWI